MTNCEDRKKTYIITIASECVMIFCLSTILGILIYLYMKYLKYMRAKIGTQLTSQEQIGRNFNCKQGQINTQLSQMNSQGLPQMNSQGLSQMNFQGLPQMNSQGLPQPNSQGLPQPNPQGTQAFGVQSQMNSQQMKSYNMQSGMNPQQPPM
uniref:Nematode cuticle collagen N-terminal domain-containing protein n=1 Tax=Strongyloides stercoralis TaxID=6248 RepID=A0A0K0DSF9_STRER